MIAAAGEAYTIAHGRAFRWSELGYQAAREVPHADGLLTHPLRCSQSVLATGRRYTPILKQVPVAEPIFRPSTWVGAKGERLLSVRLGDLRMGRTAGG